MRSRSSQKKWTTRTANSRRHGEGEPVTHGQPSGMRTLVCHCKLLLVALVATGCVSSTSGPSSTPVPNATTSTTRISDSSTSTPEVPVTASPAPAERAEPQTIGPGFLLGPKGEEIDSGGKLEFTVLQTTEGTLTIGIWPSLQPKMVTLLRDTPELYAGSTVSVLNEDFVRIVPAKPFSQSKLQDKAPAAKLWPGLAYANSKGEVLISLTEAAPPEGFQVIGQATVDQNSVDVWKTLKEGRKVESAGGLRT